MASNLGYAKHFSDLVVWKKSRLLARDVFELSQTFPAEERYALTDQIRRSSRSIGAQIAEAWAKRRYERHFISKLTDADGEQNETQHWLIVLLDAGYAGESQVGELGARCKEIDAMLGRMMHMASTFTGLLDDSESSRVQEDRGISEFFSIASEYAAGEGEPMGVFERLKD